MTFHAGISAVAESKMDALEKLQNKLLAINTASLSRLRAGDALQMQHELSMMSDWVKGASRREEVPLATIEAALLAFQQNKYLKGLRQARLICYGCTQRINSYCLIEDRDAFQKLVGHVEGYRSRRRTFRKLYRGLLNSYFSYDPDTIDSLSLGSLNRETLRVFLSHHLATFVIGDFTPDWLAALAKYPDLLSEYPGQAVESSLLQGDGSMLEEIRERLGIDGVSWLVRRLVMSPFVAIARMPDAEFKDSLASLLLLLNDYPLYASVALPLLLERYVQCKDRPMHAALRDYAVGLWGNPWLAPQQWLCGDKARSMLAHWLKRQLLREFFGLLSNDDQALSRRFNFWDLYSEDLTGMYFALGKDAYVQGNMRLYKFRHLAKGLIAKLTEEKHGVHTCIMQFSHHHVVEFNRENNIAYFYDIRQGMPSFYFAKGWVDIGAISVKDIEKGADIARTANPLRHEDTRRLIWEGRFAEELGETDNARRAFCLKYQCEYEDRRDTEGAQYIRPAVCERYGMEAWSVLKGWGYDFSEEKKIWYRLTYPKLG
jgi:hypothetical protein